MSQRDREMLAGKTGAFPRAPGQRQVGRMPDSLEAIVADYLARVDGCGVCCGEDLDGFDQEPDLTSAVRRAALCFTTLGRRHPHQRRIPALVLQQAENTLQGLQDSLGVAATFHDLYGTIRKALVGPVPGVGDLTCYDVATRIGAFLGLAPDNVFLHAGAAKGARAFGIRSHPSNPVERSRFPEALAVLSAADIENLLCIYKARLWSVTRCG